MNGFPQNLISYTKAAGQGLRQLRNLSLSALRKVFSLMGKNEKIAMAVLTVLAVGSLFVSLRNLYNLHTVPVPAAGGVYSEGLLGQPELINPLLAHDEPDVTLTKLLFAGLYKYDQSGQLTPDLADGMPVISDDQKQYTINLKRNIKWHNNKPLTADDVTFTVNLLKDPAFKSPLRPLWSATTVEKLSDYSVRFTTKDISGPFLDNLTLPILPQNIWNGVDAQNFLLSKYNLQAVGSGPYGIKEIKKLPSGKVEQISLGAFANYYNNPAKIQELVFKFYDNEQDILNAFHSREIDGFGFVPLGSNFYLDQDQPEAQILSAPLPQYQVVFFNLNNKILSDLNVRNALLAATDRQKIIDQVFAGKALLPTSPWVSGQMTATSPPSDLNQAGQLLDTAGWKIDPQSGMRVDKKGNPFSITIATNDSLVNSKAADQLAQQWQALKIKVNLNVLPSMQLTDTLIKPRAFDVLLFPQKFGANPDPFPFWHSSQIKDPGFNLTGFSDPTADQLITAARATTDKNLRQQKYQQFNDLIMSKTPIIFLDQTEYIYAVDSSVKNVRLKVLYDPSLRFSGITDWYMATSRVWK